MSSFLFGGTIEEISYSAGDRDAKILFQTHAGCMRFYDETANGLVLATTDSLDVAFVELDKEVVPYSGQSRQFMEKGCTRVIRAVGVGEEWTAAKLRAFAEQGRGGRRAVDHVEVTTNTSGVSLSVIVQASDGTTDAVAESLRRLSLFRHQHRLSLQGSTCP